MTAAGKLNTRWAHYEPQSHKTPNGAPLLRLRRLRYSWCEFSQEPAQDSVAKYLLRVRARPSVHVAAGHWCHIKGRWLKVDAVMMEPGDMLALHCSHNPSEPPPEVAP